MDDLSNFMKGLKIIESVEGKTLYCEAFENYFVIGNSKKYTAEQIRDLEALGFDDSGYHFEYDLEV